MTPKHRPVRLRNSLFAALASHRVVWYFQLSSSIQCTLLQCIPMVHFVLLQCLDYLWPRVCQCNILLHNLMVSVYKLWTHHNQLRVCCRKEQQHLHRFTCRLLLNYRTWCHSSFEKQNKYPYNSLSTNFHQKHQGYHRNYIHRHLYQHLGTHRMVWHHTYLNKHLKGHLKFHSLSLSHQMMGILFTYIYMGKENLNICYITWTSQKYRAKQWYNQWLIWW